MTERYCTNPYLSYLCPYCNEGARLVDAGIVVDAYGNPTHIACFEKIHPEMRERKVEASA